MNSIVQVYVEAMRSMNANRLRTSLTMLGIVIGITSVVLLLALGESVKKFVAKELEQLGTNMLYVLPGGDRAQQQRARSSAQPLLTLEDARALATLPSLNGVAPALQGGYTLSAGSEKAAKTVHGVTTEMFRVRNWRIDVGSTFSDADVRAAAKTAVIGHKIADQFFNGADPLGKYLRIENVAFQVVGVLYGEGKQIDGDDLGNYVLVPITAASANLVRTPFPNSVHYVVVQGSSGQLADGLADIHDVLRDRHRIRADDPDDYRIENLSTYAETANKISTGLSILLGCVGGISLIVGGIGIMNIMLVSVTERTREIGIRMAIGAKPRDILLQFLIEAMAICLVGGIVGVLIAYAAATAITSMGKFDVVISYPAVVIACLFSTAVGAFFGLYPASRASRLEPVECLRFE